MNPASIQSDFLAARAKTAITVLNATGWDQGIVNPEHVSVDSVCFYVMDCQTQWMWSCAVPRESFFAALEQSKSAKKEAAIACRGQMIAACAKASGLTTDVNHPGLKAEALAGVNYPGRPTTIILAGGGGGIL